jgi:hypothetical protein
MTAFMQSRPQALGYVPGDLGLHALNLQTGHSPGLMEQASSGVTSADSRTMRSRCQADSGGVHRECARTYTDGNRSPTS